MIRYNIISTKNAREIVLLKSRPCKWGRCFFCDYIHDNSTNLDEIIEFNKKILKNVTGEKKVLEVINSGSAFELPEETLKDIKEIILKKGIKRLILESHYMYKNRLDELKDFFGIELTFKCGVETFDDNFRNNYLKKGMVYSSIEEVASYFDSVCLMVGIKGQTKEMIKRDIEIIKKSFKYACINIYVPNTTPVQRDLELIKWFKEEYSYLEDYDNIEILWDNTDFGVGGN
ncbi:radical SAM protein [Peptostreptococcaceae bacterium AGR-M142]